MKPAPVIDTADISLAVPLLPTAGAVDFSSGGLRASFTPQTGGAPIFACSNESLIDTIVFVPAAGAVPAYFLIDLPADTREPFSVSTPTAAFADVKWFPDPSRPLRNTWLGRLKIVIHPGTDSPALLGAGLNNIRLVPVEPYDNRVAASPMIVGPQGGAGQPGSGSAVVFAQPSPAGNWIIPHTLGRRPTVSVYSAAGDEVLTDVSATETTVSIVFAQPTSGSAVLA